MASARTLVSSGSPWEPLVGYSRAVRVGSHVFVAGTTGTNDFGEAVGGLEDQARHALRKIERALKEAGARLEHVARTRTYLTDISRWEEVGRVHAEFFGEIRPASTMVEVGRLIGEGILVEIEADAVIP